MTNHPDWCTHDHEPGTDHRSDPIMFDTDYGVMVFTRTRTTTGRERVEVCTVVNLKAHSTEARTAAVHLIGRIHEATRRATRRNGEAFQ